MSQAKNADPANPFGDLTQLLEQFQVPGVDMAAAFESRRKDMDALVAANQAALAALQQLAAKQSEILRQALQSVQDGARALAEGGGVPDPGRQAELARAACEKAVAEMGELTEIVRKAQSAAMAGIAARAEQSMAEMRQLLKPTA